jgi:4-amino-4-deoxy-L-arabinose transferase-like glycosyltransferase
VKLPRGGRAAGLAAAGVVLALALAFQGTRGLWEPDEGRNVNIALGMLESGDWLVPRLNGAPYLDKPPLHFWTVAAGMSLLGAGEWGARLLHGLLFAATAGLVGALGSRLWDRPTGRRAALVYATSILPFVAGNVLTPDTPLAACGAALAYAYWRAETSAGRERTGWWLLAGLAAGLGLLAKGPALLVLLPPFALHLALRRRLGAALRSPGPWAGAVLAVGLALAWYLPVALRNPGAAAYFLDNQVVGRLATDTYRRNPGWQGALSVYLPVLLLGTLPWSGWWLARLARCGRLLPGAVRQALGRSAAARPGLSGWLRSAAEAWRRPWRRLIESPAGLLVLLWAVLPFAVYLSASSRLPLYALPIFAPLALATGRGLRQVESTSPGFRWSGLAAGLAIWCAVLLGLKGWAGFADLGRDSRRVAARIATEAPRGPYGVLVVDVHANGLPLYGLRDLRWVTLYPDAYPLFSPLPTLDQAAADLAAASRPLVVVLEPRRRAGVQAALGAAGFACTARPPVSRVALAICQPPGSPPPALRPALRTAAADHLGAATSRAGS